MLKIALFYLISYLMGFAFCIMPGPVGIEVFHHALKKQNVHALSVGFGAAIGDAVWAMVAFYGITPFLKNGQGHVVEGIFLLVASGLTLTIGILALKDAGLYKRLEQKEEAIVSRVKRKRKRWSVLKGLTMVMVNPLGIGSWIIVLSFMRKSKVYIPLELSYVVIFVGVVIAGAFTYTILMVAVTNRIKSLFEPQKITKIIRFLGYLLICFGCYFLFYSIRAFFFMNGASSLPV